jgi:hypothetical protein
VHFDLVIEKRERYTEIVTGMLVPLCIAKYRDRQAHVFSSAAELMHPPIHQVHNVNIQQQLLFQQHQATKESKTINVRYTATGSQHA